jgi:hypothetical protein
MARPVFVGKTVLEAGILLCGPENVQYGFTYAGTASRRLKMGDERRNRLRFREIKGVVSLLTTF